MQTLAHELTTTFAQDIVELAAGLGKAVIRLVTAPVERIARACDVAGVLERRSRWRASKRDRKPRRRFRWLFGSLSDLT